MAATVRYRAAGSISDGDNALFREDLEENEFEEAPVNGTARRTCRARPLEATRGLPRRLQFGFNATSGDVRRGLFGMRGRTVDGFSFFDPV